MSDRETLELDELHEGDILYAQGDDTDFAFRITMTTPNGPVGTFRDEDTLVAAQILGMIPFSHEVDSSLLPLIEPGVLRVEYGYLLVLCFQSNTDVDAKLYCVSKFSVNKPLPKE